MPFGEPWVRQINWNYALLHGESHYTFTGKERDEETGLMYFSDRYYNPDLGIFTQPDKLHYKTPGWTSYNYAANNPLRVKDPSGKIWEKPEDQKKANELIAQAQTLKDAKQTRINDLNGQAKLSKAQRNEIATLKSEITYLEEGINGLTDMGNDQKQAYHFNEVEGEVGNVSLRSDGVININCNKDEYGNTNGTAWHEAIHEIRHRNNQGLYNWISKTGEPTLLGINQDFSCGEEFRAYHSQSIFQSSSLPQFYQNGHIINTMSGIREYISNAYKHCTNAKIIMPR
jgi:RHS repeat-associated protein